MDPAHRDRIAFVRICSGKFNRGMKVMHHRLGKEITLANATIFMAQDRQNVEEAYPGDIISIHNRGTIKIGDTFSIKELTEIHRHSEFRPRNFQTGNIEKPAEDQTTVERSAAAL